MNMKGRKRGRITRLLCLLLCVLMMASLFTGCDHNRPRDLELEPESRPNEGEGTGNNSVSNGETESVSDTNPEPDPVPEPTPINDNDIGEFVNPEQIKDTFNMVVVVDTSSSIHQTDPDRLALNAPVMLFESMFAGNADNDRIAGALHANVNIITYNNGVHPCFNQLFSLDDYNTVNNLQKTLRDTTIPVSGATDEALGDALEEAVRMLVDELPKQPDSTGNPQSPPVIESRVKSLIVLFTDGYSTSGIKPTNPDPHSDMPYFGGSTQAPLERALNTAKNCQFEIVVLGLDGGSLNTYWDEFKKIADYTQTDNAEPMQRDPSTEERKHSAPEGDLSDIPPVRSAMVGGGMIYATDSDKQYVNYYRATKTVDAQKIFIQIASSLLQGTGTDTPKGTLYAEYNTYACEVKKYGITAVVFYVLSGDKQGVYLDDLIRPDGVSLAKTLNDDRGGRTETGTLWDKDQKIRKSWYDGCAILTVLNPEPGTWTLQAHTVSGDRSAFSVYMTQIGGVELELYFKQDIRYADEGTMFVRARSQGEYVTEDFYRDASGTVKIYPSRSASTHLYGEEADLWVDPARVATATGNPMKEGFLAYDSSSEAMVFKHRAPFPGTYVVDASLKVSDVEYTASGRVFFEARPSQELLLQTGGKKAITLIPELTDDWKSSVPVEVEDWSWEPRGLISVERDKKDSNALVVTGLENGAGTLDVVVVASPDNLPFQRRITISYPVQVGK